MVRGPIAAVLVLAYAVASTASCTPEEGRTVARATDAGPIDTMRPDVARDAVNIAEVGTTATGGHVVPPSLTAEGIDDSFGDHVAYAPIGKPIGRLFVLFPDAQRKPAQYDRVLRVAATAGYHAIGLAYPNAKSIDAICGSDASCYASARLEIVDAKDRTSAIAIGRANCIESRLLTLLDLLDLGWPSESWANYLDDTSAIWSTIAFAGHGDGGGQAATIASNRSVARVVFFSSPSDEIAGSPVPWVSAAHTTASALYFGISHASESRHDAHLRAFTALGLDPTHEVTTTVTPSTGPFGIDAFFGATALDAYTPLDADGKPLLASEWNLVIGP